jgi:hypothetical protein
VARLRWQGVAKEISLLQCSIVALISVVKSNWTAFAGCIKTIKQQYIMLNSSLVDARFFGLGRSATFYVATQYTLAILAYKTG